MRVLWIGSLVLLTGLPGCVAPVAVQPPPAPLIAVPGPAKSQVQFTQDDAACRGEAAQPQLQAAVAAPLPPGADQGHQAAAAAVPPGQGAQPVQAQQTAVVPPGLVYLRCMASRNNVVQQLAVASPPVVYSYWVADPFYPYGDYAPFLYGGFFGVGGFCCGGGYRYGFYDGYRGGFHEGGFHDGGFHGGGGYGGGFHGGGGFGGGGGHFGGH